MKLLLMMSMSLLITSQAEVYRSIPSVGPCRRDDDDDEAPHHGEEMMTRLLLIILPACDGLCGGLSGGYLASSPVPQAVSMLAPRSSWRNTSAVSSLDTSLPPSWSGGCRFSSYHSHEDAPAYLTAAQVADLLQVHPATVYRMAASDPSMPVLKLGGVVRFPRERLMVWLRDREQGRPRMKRQVLSAPKASTVHEAA